MSREQYVQELYGQEDAVLLTVRQSIVERGMPTISVHPELGKLLTLLVRMTRAERILEIGALGGYSGICLARALPDGGKLVSLELSPQYAELARENVERAGLGEAVQYRIGEALHSLQELADEQAKFDFFFIDADKINYPQYLEWAIRLANRGAVICADNVLLGNRVFDPANQDDSTLAMREFNKRLASDPRLEAMLLPVHDGFSIARVK